MAKRKTTINSSEDLAPLAPPQTRLLRSRKRKYPSDDISLSDDVQTTLHQQEHDGKITLVSLTPVAVVVTPLQSLQSSPLQKCVMIKDQQDEAAQQSCLTEQHSSTNEKQTEATNEAENIHLTVTEEEKATVISAIDDSQLENKHTDEKSKEEKAAGECKRSSDQTSSDQLHVSEDIDGSSASALENLEINQKNSQEDSSMISIVDVKQNTKESAAGLPAKKKQRMGVYGLTEKERRQILLIQNVEKKMKGEEICNDTDEPVIMSPSLYIPANSHKEQSEAEPKLESIHCGENNRKQNEVHATATTLDGTRTACDPEEKGCEGKGVIAPGPDQTGNPESDMSAEKAEEGGLENQLLELKGPEAETVAEKPEMQRVEVGSAEISCESAITVHTSQKEEAKEDALDAAELQMITVTRTRDEKEEETGDAVSGDRAGECASSSVEQLGGFGFESKEVCEATVTPSISEKKCSCETDVEAAADSSAVSTEGIQTRGTPDPFGSECLDYVSDSQLNTIVLIEEGVTEKEKKNESSNCHEDASDLIHGLIRELSSLNRRVMAAHRELENLRRSSKAPRSSTR